MRSKRMCQHIKYVLEFLGEGQYRAVSTVLSILGTILNVIRTIIICWLIYEKFKSNDPKDPVQRHHEKILGVSSAVLGVVSIIHGVLLWKALINNNIRFVQIWRSLGFFILLCAIGCTFACAHAVKSKTIILSFIFDDLRGFIEIFTVTLTVNQRPYEGRNASINHRRGNF